MELAQPFIGRRSELEALRNLHRQPGCHIAVVYGRRRVGKTALVNHAYAGAALLSFEGLENRGKQQQIRNFIFQLERQTPLRLQRKDSIREWREALAELVPLVSGKRVVVLLDELQWMANYRSDLVSDLKMVWEQYLCKAGNITLVLCGSIASFMEQKVLRSKALYGRTGLTIHLQPFLLSDTRHLLPSASGDDVLLAQLVVGGIPQYLSLLGARPSIAFGLDELAFSRDGFFYDEFERIFVSHFASSEHYSRIIELLARKAAGLSRAEIQDALKLPPGGELTRNLNNLESAGFISSVTPFDRDAHSRFTRYLLGDAFMRFYFEFLRPYRRKGTPQTHYFTNFVLPTPRFRSWLGRSFELLCLQHREVIATLLGFSGIEYSAGPWFQQGKRGVLEGAQLDLVFGRADGVLTVCEMKYRTGPIGVEIVREMENKLARIPILEKRTVQKVLITRSEPSRELQASSYFSRIIMASEMETPPRN
jgi:AAA+ ATPase superfamily predicted ATPase